jgi:signal transduction histidine kinase
VDINPEAKGIKLAGELNIPTSKEYKDFLNVKELNEIINVTGSETIEEELLKLKPENVEVIGGHSAKLMWGLVEERLRSEQTLKRNYETQNVIDSLLRLSLENISLEEFLDKALKRLIAIPWLSFESRGAIFLIEEGSNLLAMKSQSGLSEYILKSCNRIPLGKCLCGRAALMKQVQFSNCLDALHEVRYEDITPHGHYCIPILSAGKSLGVINLYIKEGYNYDIRDQDFLIAVANTLAGVIERKRAEDALKKAYIKLKETQQELIQSEKLAALGRFSSGVAHEVKNPLGIMLGGIEFLERKLSLAEEDVKTAVLKIKEAILKADNVLQGLLKFSRPSELKIERIKAADLINEALSFYNYRAPLSNISIKMEAAENDIYLDVDKNQMQQVIFNLMINSIDALPKGGEIRIKIHRKSLPEFSLEQAACVIEIKDSGIGISKEDLSRVFEPFFTTKRDKKGTGLGLSVAKMIVENHKGNLEVESELGKGTVVRIILPESLERKA